MENNKETKSDKSAQPQVEDSHPSVSSMHPMSLGIIPGLQVASEKD